MTNIEHIEKGAIYILEGELVISDKVTPRIPSNDKTPSWDGHIFLAKDLTQKKIGCFVPIQVKGKYVKQYKGNNITYSVKVADLINYKEHHGVIYFVIHMKTRKEGIVYFEYLLPADIDRYLRGKEHQKSISITLKKFNSSSAQSVETILGTFAIEFNKQNNRTVYSDDFTKLKSITLPRTVRGGNGFFNSIIGCEAYVHGELQKDNDFVDVASRISIEEAVCSQTSTLIMGENSMTVKTQYITNKEGFSILVGTGIKFRALSETVKFHDVGTLDERILNYEVLINMIKAGEVLIDNWKINNISPNFSISEAETNYEKLLKIREFLNFIGVYEDVDLYSITEDEKRILNHLMEIKYEEKFSIDKDNEVGFFHVQLSDVQALIFIRKGSNNRLIIENLFGEQFNPNIMSLRLNDNETIIDLLPVYLAIGFESLKNTCNIDFNKILESIQSIDFTPNIYSLVNGFALNLIRVYDASSNIEALECAIEIFNRMINAFDDELLLISKINLYQCVLRRRDYHEHEVDHLINMKESLLSQTVPDHMFLWAINVLLQNKYEVKNIWAKISDEDRDAVMDYPIFVLYEKLVS